MRKQLNNIERVERYLNNQLSHTELELFEKELHSNPELKELSENLQNLRKAVSRTELRSILDKNAKGNGNWRKGLIVSVILLLIGSAVWFLFPSDRYNGVENQNHIESAETFAISSTDSTKGHADIDRSEPENLIADGAERTDTTFELGGHELWVQPEVQSFKFNNSEGATIVGREGILIIVPTNAFIDEDGNVIKGEIDLDLVEALGITEMVLYKLKTVSNGSSLESGGMFYMEARSNGRSLKVNPNRPLYIEIPTTTKIERMQAFRGEVGEDGKINWVDPKPLKKYLVKLPLEDLDFLPGGFAPEVESNMPFLNYNEASSRVTDSLYYSLQRNQAVTEYSEIEADFGNKNSQEIWGDSVLIERSIKPATKSELESPITCGIDPTAIETIKTSRFSNTFIATKEFEARVAYLHKASNGNQLLQIYVDNLGRNLKESDALVSQSADLDWKERFQAFANENLTNVKDADIYQARLSEYYQKKRAELKYAHQELADQLTQKNANELRSILADLAVSSIQASSVTPMLNYMPVPTAATSQVYATPWTSMGWGNIDRYMKLLNGEQILTPIIVSNMAKDAEATQWLNSINTYTDLNKVEGQFSASFPKRKGKSNFETHVFAIARTDSGYSWGMERYDPYKDKTVEFAMALASSAEIRTQLTGLEATLGKIQQRMTWRKRQAQRMVKYQMDLKRRQEIRNKQRAEIYKKYEKAKAAQKAVENTLNRLRKVAFPCAIEDAVEMEEPDNTSYFIELPDYSVYRIVENMPKYSGGDEALLNFITKNVRYPIKARETGILGVVYVSYIVDETGQVRQAKVVRGVNEELDAEALRVVNLITGYAPGTQRGKPVSVQFTIPIKFSLN